MFYTEQRPSLKVIHELDKFKDYYEYADHLIKNYRQGKIPERQIAYLVQNNVVVAYMLFNMVIRDYVQQIMRKEGVDIVLPSHFGNMMYLDTLDVTTVYRKKGIGTGFVNFALKFNLPILLQATNESEMFWESHGFRHLDYGWIIRG